MAKVLIIDDDTHITRLLQTHLTEEGYEVVVAHGGEEGMTQAKNTSPDLILLDVMLPDATGFQMCSRFRQTASTQSIPIIMMTGVAKFPNQQVFGRERGANEYVLKPFKVLELGDLVHSYIGNEDQRRKSSPLRVIEPSTPIALNEAVTDDSQKSGTVLSGKSVEEMRRLIAQALSNSKKPH